MPKPIRPRSPTVIISDHAFERWIERAERRPKRKSGLAALLEMMLYTLLRAGGVVTVGLAVELDLGGGIRAVLRIGEFGWVCTTVMDVNEPRESEAG